MRRMAGLGFMAPILPSRPGAALPRDVLGAGRRRREEYAFFLHSGPSLGSFFSVMWPSPPAALRGAALSALICVHCVHWAGTLASAKIASTGHSGTHASQSMQS